MTRKEKKERRPRRLEPPLPLPPTVIPPTVAVPPPSSLPPLARGRDELIIVDKGTIDDAPPRGRGRIICRAYPPGVVSPALYPPNGLERPRMPMDDKSAAAALLMGAACGRCNFLWLECFCIVVRRGSHTQLPATLHSIRSPTDPLYVCRNC